ncbi:MAG TPA: condensation domain-containing protein [Vicinamibacterales bacterium]
MTVPLDTLPAGQRAAVEDAYQLSPMQQGMLYDTIQSSRPGMYCIVVAYRIEGRLDGGRLFDAWRAVLTRHPILRTSFHWRDRSEPFQAVHSHVALPVVEHDWRGLSPDEQRRRLTAVLSSENLEGFDVTTPPLIRLTLIRCAEAVHELVVAHHHLLLDGSCKPLLFNEVFAFYEHPGHEPLQLAKPEPYRRFIEWLDEQDLESAESFWRDELQGFSEPTPLWSGVAVERQAVRDYDEHHTDIDETITESLRRFARTNRVTLNTVISGAWALLIGHASRRDDVVFGATVNARPAGLDGVEAMMGLFINTLPVRVVLSRTSQVADWLKAIQTKQTTSREYDYAPLPMIRQWSSVPRRLPLFESILVFENNPGYGIDSERHGDIEITNARALIRNSLPLTLRCVPGRRLGIQLLYDTGRFSASTIQGIADGLVRLLTEIPVAAFRPLSHLTAVLDGVGRERNEAQANAFQQAARGRLTERARSRVRSDES